MLHECEAPPLTRLLGRSSRVLSSTGRYHTKRWCLHDGPPPHPHSVAAAQGRSYPPHSPPASPPLGGRAPGGPKARGPLQGSRLICRGRAPGSPGKRGGPNRSGQSVQCVRTTHQLSKTKLWNFYRSVIWILVQNTRRKSNETYSFARWGALAQLYAKHPRLAHP